MQINNECESVGNKHLSVSANVYEACATSEDYTPTNTLCLVHLCAYDVQLCEVINSFTNNVMESSAKNKNLTCIS